MKYATHSLPGIGGRYKQTPADFQVEEIPLYPCSGEGEHLYLWIEKTGITTHELLTQLARKLKIRERAIGYAGLKDARALTRQMVSIPFDCLDRLGHLTLEKAKILKIDRHGNKLRLGHLKGNLFTITLHETIADPRPRLEAILAALQKCGIPNLFGEQRYGSLGNSAQLGQLLLRKNYADFIRELIGDPAKIVDNAWRQAAQCYRRGDLPGALKTLPRRMGDERRLLQALATGQSQRNAVFTLPHPLLRLFLSAAQAHLFDQLLFRRLPDLGQLQDGDIAVKHANGACFRVLQAALEQSRAERLEISPSAPLFGHKVLIAAGIQGDAERDILRRNNLQLSDWKLGRGLTMAGERRPLRVPLVASEITAVHRNSVTLRFSLPRGSYATSLLREVIKQP